jgi:hypothetical protein
MRWALAQLNEWTWLVAQYRGWLITLAVVVGGAVPLLSAARRRLPRAAPSLVVRSGAMALALSAAAVAICSLLHFSDLRWLALSQRKSVHLSAPSGLLSFARPTIDVVNTVAGRMAGSQGVSPHRRPLRAPGVGSYGAGGPVRAQGPARRYPADRAGGNTEGTRR